MLYPQKLKSYKIGQCYALKKYFKAPRLGPCVRDPCIAETAGVVVSYTPGTSGSWHGNGGLPGFGFFGKRSVGYENSRTLQTVILGMVIRRDTNSSARLYFQCTAENELVV